MTGIHSTMIMTHVTTDAVQMLPSPFLGTSGFSHFLFLLLYNVPISRRMIYPCGHDTCSIIDHIRYPEHNDHDTCSDKSCDTIVAEPFPIIVYFNRFLLFYNVSIVTLCPDSSSNRKMRLTLVPPSQSQESSDA